MAKTRQSIDEALLLALACGGTVENAARSAGTSARTAHRRLQEPGFQQRLRAMRCDMVQRTAGMLTAASLESVKTLLALQEGSQPPNVRLGAARAIVELGLKVREMTEVHERLAVLEGKMLPDVRGQEGWPSGKDGSP